nr:Ycf58 [Sahlingia subintegra]
MVLKNHEQCIDIATFFRMNLGNWLTQKTSYNPNSKQYKTSTSKTYINKTDNKTIIQPLLANNELQDLLLIKNQTEIYDINSEQGKRKVSSILTYINKDNKTTKSNGIIYKVSQNKKNKIIQGKFELDKGVLKVFINNNKLSIEESIWFINNNLKLTQSIIKQNNHCVHISFASEIKIKSDD